MIPPAIPERYKNHRFPTEIISHGVWLYYPYNSVRWRKARSKDSGANGGVVMPPAVSVVRGASRGSRAWGLGSGSAGLANATRSRRWRFGWPGGTFGRGRDGSATSSGLQGRGVGPPIAVSMPRWERPRGGEVGCVGIAQTGPRVGGRGAAVRWPPGP